MTRAGVLLVLVLVVACGDGTSAVGSPTSGAAVTVVSAPPTSAPAGDDSILADLSALQSYRFQVSTSAGDDHVVSGEYDGPGASIRLVDQIGTATIETVHVNGRDFVRGDLVPLMVDSSANGTSWYEVIGADSQWDGLVELPLHMVPVRAAEVAATEVGDEWTLGEEEMELLRRDEGTVLDLDTDGLTISVRRVEEGFEYSMTWDASSLTVLIEPADVTIEAPEASEQLEVGLPLRDEPTVIVPDEDGVLFDAARYGGLTDLRLSVEASGRVVQVTDSSVFATRGAHTTWTLHNEAVELLVGEIEDSGLLGHPDANLQFGQADGEGFSIGYNSGRVLNVHGPPDAPGLDEEQRERRRIFFDLFDRLTDHSWLEEHIVESAGPHVPDSLTLRGQPTASPPTLEWPLASPLRDHEVEPGYFCLEGDDARLMWEAIGDLTFNDVVVTDGARPVALLLRPHLPGYRLYGDPCQAQS